MTVQNYCRYCGKTFFDDPQDVEKHQKNHERRILAERVFGHIANYNERQFLKDEAHKNNNGSYNQDVTEILGGQELIYYIEWSRSVEGCGYDLKHPTLQEYILFRKTSDCIFLNGTYVNMKIYKEHLNK